MKKLFISITLIALVVSCSKEYSSDEYGGYEMMTDYMLSEYEQGSALRQISQTGEFQAATPGTSIVNWTFEPHDPENGSSRLKMLKCLYHLTVVQNHFIKQLIGQQ